MKPRYNRSKKDENSSILSTHSFDPLLSSQESSGKVLKDEHPKVPPRAKNKSSSESAELSKSSKKDKKAKRDKSKDRDLKEELFQQNTKKESKDKFFGRKGKTNEQQKLDSFEKLEEWSSEGIYQIPTVDSITDICVIPLKAISDNDKESSKSQNKKKIESDKIAKKSKESVYENKEKYSDKAGRKKKKSKEDKNIVLAEPSLSVKSLKAKKKGKEGSEVPQLSHFDYKVISNDEVKKRGKTTESELGVKRSDTKELLNLTDEESDIVVKDSTYEVKITEAKVLVVEQSPLKEPIFKATLEPAITPAKRGIFRRGEIKAAYVDKGVTYGTNEPFFKNDYYRNKESQEEEESEVSTSYEDTSSSSTKEEGDSSTLMSNECQEEYAWSRLTSKIGTEPASVASITRRKVSVIKKTNEDDLKSIIKDRIKCKHENVFSLFEQADNYIESNSSISKVTSELMSEEPKTNSTPMEVVKINKTPNKKHSKPKVRKNISKESETKMYPIKEKGMITEETPNLKIFKFTGTRTEQKPRKPKTDKLQTENVSKETTLEKNSRDDKKERNQNRINSYKYYRGSRGQAERKRQISSHPEEKTRVKSDIVVPPAKQTSLVQSIGSSRKNLPYMELNTETEDEEDSDIAPKIIGSEVDQVEINGHLVKENNATVSSKTQIVDIDQSEYLNAIHQECPLSNKGSLPILAPQKTSNSSSKKLNSRALKGSGSDVSGTKKTIENSADSCLRMANAENSASKLSAGKKKGSENSTGSKLENTSIGKMTSKDLLEDNKNTVSDFTRLADDKKESCEDFNATSKAYNSKNKIKNNENKHSHNKPMLESIEESNDKDLKKSESNSSSSAISKKKAKTTALLKKDSNKSKKSVEKLTSSKVKLQTEPSVKVEKKRSHQDVKKDTPHSKKIDKTDAIVKEKILDVTEKDMIANEMKDKEFKASRKKDEERNDSKKSKLESYIVPDTQTKDKQIEKRKSSDSTVKTQPKKTENISKQEEKRKIHDKEKIEDLKAKAKKHPDDTTAKTKAEHPSKVLSTDNIKRKSKEKQTTVKKEPEELSLKHDSSRLKKEKAKPNENIPKVEQTKPKKPLESKENISVKEKKKSDDVTIPKRSKEHDPRKVDAKKDEAKEEKGHEIERPKSQKKSSDSRKMLSVLYEDLASEDPKVLQRKRKKKESDESFNKKIGYEENIKKQFMKEIADKKRKKKSMEGIEELKLSDIEEVIQTVYIRDIPKKTIEGTDSEEYIEKVYFRESPSKEVMSGRDVSKPVQGKKKKTRKVSKDKMMPMVVDEAPVEIPPSKSEDQKVEVGEPQEQAVPLETTSSREEVTLREELPTEIPIVEEPQIVAIEQEIEEAEVEGEEESLLDYPKKVASKVLDQIEELKIPSASEVLNYIKEKISPAFEEKEREKEIPILVMDDIKVGAPKEVPKEPCSTPISMKKVEFDLSKELNLIAHREEIAESSAPTPAFEEALESPQEPTSTPASETSKEPAIVSEEEVEILKEPARISEREVEILKEPARISEREVEIPKESVQPVLIEKEIQCSRTEISEQDSFSLITSTTERYADSFATCDTLKMDEESLLEFKTPSMTDTSDKEILSKQTSLDEGLGSKFASATASWESDLAKIVNRPDDEQVEVLSLKYPSVTETVVTKTSKITNYSIPSSTTDQATLSPDKNRSLDKLSGIREVEEPTPAEVKIIEKIEIFSREFLPSEEYGEKEDKYTSGSKLGETLLQDTERSSIYKMDGADVGITDEEKSETEIIQQEKIDSEIEKESDVEDFEKVEIYSFPRKTSEVVEDDLVITVETKDRIIDFLRGKLPSEKIVETSAILDMVTSQGNIASQSTDSVKKSVEEHKYDRGKCDNEDEGKFSFTFTPADSFQDQTASEQTFSFEVGESVNLIEEQLKAKSEGLVEVPSQLPQQSDILIHTSNAIVQEGNHAPEAELQRSEALPESPPTSHFVQQPQECDQSTSHGPIQPGVVAAIEDDTSNPKEDVQKTDSLHDVLLEKLYPELKKKNSTEASGLKEDQVLRSPSGEEVKESSKVRKLGLFSYFWDDKDSSKP